MPAGWKFKEPGAPSIEIALPNTQTFFMFDATWMGIRKGGRRFYVLQSGGGTINAHDTDVVGPDYTIVPVHDPTLTTPVPRGLTNDKRYFVMVIWDVSGANVDSLQYNELDGTFVQAFRFSDGPLQKNRALVFMEHDFYVLRTEEEDTPGDIRVYDAQARLIRVIGFPQNHIARGITTDGKALYIMNTFGTGTITKMDVRGNVIDIFALGFGGDTETGRWPITFNGRYLVINTFDLAPG